MRTLIVYASKSGTTEKCANELAHKIKNTDIINLRTDSVDLTDYDTIIIGGSIRYGRLHKLARNFMEDNLSLLLQKNIALFICCGFSDQVEQHFSTNFPAKLLEQAFVKENFGGEIHPESLNLFERKITQMAMRSANVTTPPKILTGNINHFVHEVQLHAH